MAYGGWHFLYAIRYRLCAIRYLPFVIYNRCCSSGGAMPEYDYDMVVIGSGPAGQGAAVQAAKLDKRVALVERKAVIGGVCINTGTIPSKTLREAVLHLPGYRERGVYGASYTVKQNITMDDLLFRAD